MCTYVHTCTNRVPVDKLVQEVCHRYWPESGSSQYGEYMVGVFQQSYSEGYTERILGVTDSKVKYLLLDTITLYRKFGKGSSIINTKIRVYSFTYFHFSSEWSDPSCLTIPAELLGFSGQSISSPSPADLPPLSHRHCTHSTEEEPRRPHCGALQVSTRELGTQYCLTWKLIPEIYY